MTVEHPLSGETHQAAPIVDLEQTPTGVRGPAPLLGEHTVDILSSAGFGDAEIDDLLGRGIAFAQG